MNSEKLPHIGLDLPDNFPEELISKFKEELYHPELAIGIRKIHLGGPYNSMEWAIPTAIGVYILKPYFESFLSEAGKDHYEVLKKWIKKTAENSRQIKVTTLAASSSTDKLDSGNTQSKSFSIQIISKRGTHKIKFLFDENLSQQSWDNAIDKLFVLMKEHYSQDDGDLITINLLKDNLDANVWAIISSDDDEWKFLDFRKIAEKKIAQRKSKTT